MAEALVSDPAAGIVSTTPTGRRSVTGRPCRQISHRSFSGCLAPMAMALAVSMALPPPTARIISARSARARRTPSRAWATTGLGRAPPKRMGVQPACSRYPQSLSSRPERRALPPPLTTSTRRPPYFWHRRPASFSAAAPKTISVGT